MHALTTYYCLLTTGFYFGVKIMVMFLPSSLGDCSTLNLPVNVSNIFWNDFIPNSGLIISLPLKNIITFALLPSSRKRLILFTFKPRSCSVIWGLILISLISADLFCVCFLLNWYLYFPKSSILQTGGLTFAATSTRSSSLSPATLNASFIGTIPSWFPSKSISLTSLALICALTLISLLILSPPDFKTSNL